jgi:endonuclease YncB( thermonuclease family)
MAGWRIIPSIALMILLIVASIRTLASEATDAGEAFGRINAVDCSVGRVIDGDTIALVCPSGGDIRARLIGFDAPEVFNPACAREAALGAQATARLEQELGGARDIRMAFAGTDRYGRHLTRMTLDGRDVAELMIEADLARAFPSGRRIDWCRERT